ncbi:MAG: nucleotidyltransferase [Acidobacteriota bacterium]
MLVSTAATIQLDDLLDRIGVKLQLSETAYKLAENRYKAIAVLLGQAGSSVAKYRPDIYPQGSLRIGTTVKLRRRNEFDLDFVCEFQASPETFPDPIVLLDFIEEILRGNGVYKDNVERKNRCIRVIYADEFYMDILPACPNPSPGLYGSTCVLVPDCSAQTWKHSNPKGFARWYEGRAQEAVVTFRKAIEPLPEHQSYEDLATLNRIVQLMKRHRDIIFEKCPKQAPISIVLTTLAAKTYAGHTSVSEAMAHVLRGICALIPNVADGRLQVLNPTNSGEDLSERWDDDPEAYLGFVSWINAFAKTWNDLLNVHGIQNAKIVLEKMFGERVARTAVEEHIKAFEAPRQSGGLAVERGSGLIVPAATASATAISRNTFYGDQ